MRSRLSFATALFVVLMLVGCGAPPATTTRTPAPRSSATVTLSPSPVPTASFADFAAACKNAAQQWTFKPVYRIGDLLIESGYVGIASRKLPDETPLTPLLIPNPNDQAAVDAQIPVQPVLNPLEGGGFGLKLCNASATHAHEIEAITIRIAQVVSYAGHVQTWNICDGYYSRSEPGGVAGAGCGFGFQSDETMHVAFPANAGVGTIKIATQVDSSDAPTDLSRSSPYGPLPVTLAPGQGIVMFVTATLPTLPGTYTFEVQPEVDHIPVAFTTIGEPAFLAPAALKWSGKACLKSTMQSQIPAATDPPSYYICPDQ